MSRLKHRTTSPAMAVPGKFFLETKRRESRTSLARDLGACVYAVRTPDRLIKIGFTTNLGQRIRAFGSVWDDVLLALPGTKAAEKELHERFERYRARGDEYYFPCRELVEWIEAERERMGIQAPVIV